MEYLLKASGLVAIFYICYKLFLQRETFFEQNRWFLLSGLITSFIIPFLVIPIYIEYTPAEILPNYTIIETQIDTTNTEETLNLINVSSFIYYIGVIAFLIRFIIQLFSLNTIINSNKKEKKGQYTYILVSKNIAPFSFFNWIVFNPNNFTELELRQIITHEKVHAKQKHSIDILLTQITSIVLWFNPFIWFYNKALKQNLEFIADKETQQKFSCNKSYQTTLLKTSVPSHQMALSNPFYNSLIKKRIVMLQKSKSKKINLIKYAIVMPLLAVFLMSFNTEEVYIKKNNLQTKKQSSINNSDLKIIINKDLSDNDLNKIKQKLSKNNIRFTFKKLKRNNKKEIINILTKFEYKNGLSATWNSYNIDNKPIKSFYFFKSKNDFGVRTLEMTIPNKEKTTSSQIYYSFPKNHDAIITGKSDAGVIIKASGNGKTPLYILNDKEITEKEMKELAPEDIKEISVLKGELATEKYAEKGKDGVIEITTKKQKWETKFIIEKPMNNIQVIGYGKPKVQEGKTTTSSDSIFFNKTKQTISKNPWKVTIGVNAEKNNDNVFKLTSIDGKEPIFIKDGKEITKEELQKINPIDIELVSVIKDEKAINAYGDKGKDGVVLITTKKNKQSPWKVTTKRNKNVIFATKDTIYIKEKQHLLKQLSSSFNQQPLYILDGKEINAKDITALDEMKVERISHIKNSEIAIKKFGERAKNGVIEITSRTENSKTPIVKIVGSSIYIINGKEISDTEFNNLSPEDIKTINIIKGDAAIKKYGNKAKDGAIEITTKK